MNRRPIPVIRAAITGLIPPFRKRPTPIKKSEPQEPNFTPEPLDPTNHPD